MRRSSMRRSRVERDWTAALAKVNAEGRCRACRRTARQLRQLGRRLEAAHTLGRAFDVKLEGGRRFVHRHSVVPLCGPPTTTETCHARFDAHALDLWPMLTVDERAWAVGRVGEGQAERRLRGRAL